ncbi:MAG: NAD(P)/FAD-dependent oxidoreductase [Dongiaceae bacterium]
MTSPRQSFDAIVIGGGFYGCSIALELKRHAAFDRICLVDREPTLMQHASAINQARLHMGYHYPRSVTTALRSRVNLPRFVADHPACVVDRFQSIYCVARRNSRLSARQFAKFCQQIGATARPAPPSLRRLFSDRSIEASFMVEEFAFDADKLRRQLEASLLEQGIDLRLGTTATMVDRADETDIAVTIESAAGTAQLTARWLFNCGYAGLGGVPGLGQPAARLKHEIAEIAIVEVPDELAGLAVTVMDGPFFSVMPHPPSGHHSLTHVRYTPHFSWTSAEANGADSYAVLAAYRKTPRIGQMIRDASRYLPALASARPVESRFEIKTVLMANEVDDGRPILFEQHARHPRCFSVLGGKIDNIYDVREVLRGLPFHG